MDFLYVIFKQYIYFNMFMHTQSVGDFAQFMNYHLH